MGHKALKVSLIVVLGLFAFTALAGIAAYWRLTQGPLPISFLQSSIESAINAQLSGLKITLADTVLELDTDTYVPSVRARNIVLKDAAGGIANISTYDVLQSNGIIHVIDHVLLPRM